MGEDDNNDDEEDDDGDDGDDDDDEEEEEGLYLKDEYENVTSVTMQLSEGSDSKAVAMCPKVLLPSQGPPYCPEMMVIILMMMCYDDDNSDNTSPCKVIIFI